VAVLHSGNILTAPTYRGESLKIHMTALADLGFLEGVTLGTRASEASEH